MQWRKENVQETVLETLDVYMGRLELNLYLSLYTKISSKYIKALTLKLKLPEEKVKCVLQDIGLCEDLVNRIPVAHEIRPIINK